MPETDETETAQEATASQEKDTSATEAAIDAALDAWIVRVANAGEPWAMRRADLHLDDLKNTIHTILKEN